MLNRYLNTDQDAHATLQGTQEYPSVGVKPGPPVRVRGPLADWSQTGALTTNKALIAGSAGPNIGSPASSIGSFESIYWLLEH